MKELEETEIELGWLEIRMIKQRIKKELGELEIKILKIET